MTKLSRDNDLLVAAIYYILAVNYLLLCCLSKKEEISLFRKPLSISFTFENFLTYLCFFFGDNIRALIFPHTKFEQIFSQFLILLKGANPVANVTHSCKVYISCSKSK